MREFPASTPKRSRPAMAARSVWRKAAGGFTCGAAPNVAISAVATALRISMRARHYHETGHPAIQSFEPGEGWFWSYPEQVQIRGERLAPPYWRSLLNG